MNHAERNTPKVTVDIIIELIDWDRHHKEVPCIVLIERKNEPMGFALPGGFVDVGERAIDAAIREALEETTLRLTNIKQFHTYTSPGRDPRGHGISIVYVAQAIGDPKGEDDAKQAFAADPIGLSGKITDSLCFDHRQIITDYINWKLTGHRPLGE